MDDGRLELDGYGRARDGDGATTDLRPPELLDGGRDRATTTERAVAGVRGSRGWRWATGHRRTLASVLVLVGLLAVGTGWYLRTRPPPEDLQARVVVFSDGRFQSADNRHWAQDVEVVSSAPASQRVEVLGVFGPGLASNGARPVPGPSSEPSHATVTATLRCADQGWWSAGLDQYVIRIRRTDTYGRVRIFDVPEDETQSGWMDVVRGECLAAALQHALSVDGPVAVPAPRLAQVVVTGRVANGTDHPLWVRPAPWQDSVSVGKEPWQLLAAHRSASVRWVLQRSDCASAPELPSTDDGAPALPVDVVVALGPAATTPTGQDTTGWSRLSGVDVTTVTRALAAVCRGAPPVRPVVTSVHRDGADVDFTIAVALSTTADAVEFGTRGIQLTGPDQYSYVDLGFVLPAFAAGSNATLWRTKPLSRGRAGATVRWTPFDCDTATQSGPLTLPLLLTSHGREYPVAVPLDQRVVLAALRAACDGHPDRTEAADLGWPSAAR